MRPVMGGQIRRLSLIQAWRYGKLRDSVSMIGEDTRPCSTAVSISARSLMRTMPLVTTCSMKVRSTAAVVSEPAMLEAVNKVGETQTQQWCNDEQCPTFAQETLPLLLSDSIHGAQTIPTYPAERQLSAQISCRLFVWQMQ